jgi:cyclophilin family peptidyl-prolyl cis-trans isomerase
MKETGRADEENTCPKHCKRILELSANHSYLGEKRRRIVDGGQPGQNAQDPI